MKDLVEVIAKSLVDHPEEVVVNQTEESNYYIYWYSSVCSGVIWICAYGG